MALTACCMLTRTASCAPRQAGAGCRWRWLPAPGCPASCSPSRIFRWWPVRPLPACLSAAARRHFELISLLPRGQARALPHRLARPFQFLLIAKRHEYFHHGQNQAVFSMSGRIPRRDRLCPFNATSQRDKHAISAAGVSAKSLKLPAVLPKVTGADGVAVPLSAKVPAPGAHQHRVLNFSSGLSGH